MKTQKFVQLNRKFLIGFLLIDIFFFSLSYFFGLGVHLAHILLMNVGYVILIALITLKSKTSSKNIPLLLFFAFANSSLSVLLLFSIMFMPGSKEHNYVMYNVCFPAIKKHYGLSENQAFPASELDAAGWGKWWYQHSECEKNVRSGKGPIFSENPSEFVPIKK